MKIRTAFLLPMLLAAGFALAQARVAFDQPITGTPGKRMIAVVVEYAPGAKSPSHHHAKSAFIYAHVLSGAIRSQVNNGPAKVYKAGENFHEEPGDHHRVSENASDKEPAKLLAIFVVDDGDKPLTTPD